MSRDDSLNLDGALDSGDVSLAWMVWSSAVEAAGHLEDWFRSWVPDSVFSAGVDATLLKLGIPLLLILKRFFLGMLIPMFIFLLLMLFSPLIRLMGVFRIWF